MSPSKTGNFYLAGFLATVVFTAIFYAAPFLKMPGIDIAGMLGEFITRSPALMGSIRWILGLLLVFVTGTLVLPLIFSKLLYPRLPGPGWAKGMEWGFILWLIAQAVIMPIMEMGFFSSKLPASGRILAVTLVAYLAYGAILGAVYQASALRHGASPGLRHVTAA